MGGTVTWVLIYMRVTVRWWYFGWNCVWYSGEEERGNATMSQVVCGMEEEVGDRIV